MNPADAELPPGLLAVDLGVRCGLARFGADGRLAWYRSRNYGSRGRLRRAVRHVLDEAAPLARLVLEGPRPLAELWQREGERRGLAVQLVSAEQWRPTLLLPRERRAAKEAKRTADGLARRVIAWSGARRPTSLRHDVAEAILIGLWACLEAGWLEGLPAALR